MCGLKVRFTQSPELRGVFAYSLKVEVVSATDIPSKIFVYHQSPAGIDGNTFAEFDHVATPVDFQEIPEDAASNTVPWYRTNKVVVWFRNVSDLNLAKQMFVDDIHALQKTYDVLTSNDNLERQSDIEFVGNGVHEECVPEEEGSIEQDIAAMKTEINRKISKDALDGVSFETNDAVGVREAVKIMGAALGAKIVKSIALIFGLCSLYAHGAGFSGEHWNQIDWDENPMVVTNVTFDGIASDADIYAAVQQIAPAWESGVTYMWNALVTYNGVVYQNTSGSTITSTTPPNTDTTRWTAKPVSELFLPKDGDASADVGVGSLYAVGKVYADEGYFWGGAEAAGINFYGMYVGANGYNWAKRSGVFALLQNFAPDFSTSATYEVNELCVYDNELYRCTTAITTAGAWDSSKWTVATVQDILSTSNLKTGFTSGIRLDNSTASGLVLYFRPRAFGMHAGDKIHTITLHTSSSTSNTSSPVYARLVKYTASSQTYIALSEATQIQTRDVDVEFTFESEPAVDSADQYYRLELTTSTSTDPGANPINASLRVYYEQDGVRKPDCYFFNSQIVPVMSVKYRGAGNPVILNTDNCIGSGVTTYHTGSTLNIQGQFTVLTNGTVTVQSWDQIRLASGQTLPEFIAEAIVASSGNVSFNATDYDPSSTNLVTVESLYMDATSISNAVKTLPGAQGTSVVPAIEHYSLPVETLE